MELKTIEILGALNYRLTCVLADGHEAQFDIQARPDFGLELAPGLEQMLSHDPRAARDILWSVSAFHRARQPLDLLKTA